MNTLYQSLWLLVLLLAVMTSGFIFEYVFFVIDQYKLTRYEIFVAFCLHVTACYLICQLVSTNIIVYFVILIFGLLPNAGLYNLHLWYTRKTLVR